jgi:glycosidase
MQWEAGNNAGFSSAVPWLPLHKNSVERNVAKQSEDPKSLLNFYRQMLALRRETPALSGGEMAFIEGIPKGVLAYRRKTPISEAVVLLNFRKTDIRCVLSEEKRIFQKVLSSKDGLYRNQAISTVHLKPDEVLVLTVTHSTK